MIAHDNVAIYHRASWSSPSGPGAEGKEGAEGPKGRKGSALKVDLYGKKLLHEFCPVKNIFAGGCRSTDPHVIYEYFTAYGLCTTQRIHYIVSFKNDKDKKKTETDEEQLYAVHECCSVGIVSGHSCGVISKKLIDS